jgi:GDP-D-mannose 3',5'-epimerase
MILVTGGAGFIGSHLVKILRDRGEKVIVVDDFSTGSRENLEYLGVGDTEILEIDLTNFRDAKKALEGADIVFHMGARVGGIPFLHGDANIELLSLQVNLAIDANVFRACQQVGVKKIIYPSSVSVYPLALQQYPGAVFSEEAFVFPQHYDHVSPLRMSVDPDGGYGLAKILGEIELTMMRGIRIGIARIFSAYGENEPLGTNSHVLSRFIQNAIQHPEGQMVIWGDGTQTRDYVYVTDCAEALVKLADKLEEVPSNLLVVNVGSGRGISINQLAEKVVAISGKEMRLVYDREKPVGPVSRTADISRAKELLGWEPKVSLEEGLMRTYKWIESKMTNE